jgi:orotidine-5'-phosphate decarboxylase
MKKKSNNSAKERLIFALDTGVDFQNALAWVDLLKDHVGMFKVGKEVFTNFGPLIVSEIRARGGKVFLDLKFHDIPNTVAQAARAAVGMGVSMFNIHALGGKGMMSATVESVKKRAVELNVPQPIILAVTILTSLDDSDLKEMGFCEGAANTTVNLAKLASDAGVSGVVASAHDVVAIRKACDKNFLIVTPGVRLNDTVSRDDQKRILTPEEAINRGADYIVVGRPISQAKDPVAVAEIIGNDIDRGLFRKKVYQS